jgi:flagellar motor protein MotB
LSLTTCSAYAGIEAVDYKVVNNSSSIYRRADITFTCPIGESKVISKREVKGGDFVLEVVPQEESINVSISFKGSGIRVNQPLLNGQKIGGALLQKLEPLSGRVINSMELPVKDNGTSVQIEAKNLQPGNYKLVYEISTLKNDDSILAPEVEIISEGREKQEEQREETSLKEDSEKITFTVPVFFGPGEYTINYKNRLLLDGVKPLVKYCSVKITGYANGTPIVKTNVDSNQELAKRRAEAVKRYLEREE